MTAKTRRVIAARPAGDKARLLELVFLAYTPVDGRRNKARDIAA
jgi:hypothetical protein